jgi:hypothetical protein
MEKRQITRQELVAVEIRDWAPEATAAIAKPSIAEAWRKKHPASS